MQTSFLFDVDFRLSTQHLVEVVLWLPTAQIESPKLIFPVWTPGSYMVREYTRNIEQISAAAYDGLHGRKLDDVSFCRIGKNVWHVDGENAPWTAVTYRLYCREMSVRTNWVESEFGFITGAATFPYVDGFDDRCIELNLRLPETWRNIATSLCQRQTSDQIIRLSAENFDELVDSPIVLGNFPVRSFCAGGKPHYLAHVGDSSLWDLDRAVADVEKIVSVEQKFWGEAPYEDYWFLNLVTEAGGGLEHDNSTVLMTSRWAMRKRETYLNWLALVSHEFFHTWNVRRLRPKTLMSYDYQQEQFFPELWIAEGITSYFDDLALVWSDLCTRDEYLGRLSKNIQAVQTAPGRLVQPLDDASWDAWVKHYRPDENSHNARISYYLKGAVLAWLLDTQLLEKTGGRHGLSSVMRLLWSEHRHTGYTLEDFERLVEQLGGSDLRLWLGDQVHRAEEFDYVPALRYLGLRFKSNARKEGACERPGCDVWIGSDSTASDGRLIVRRVYRGSPSAEAGLNVDDELLALDQVRITPESWPDRLLMYTPGQKLDLLVARRGLIQSLQICLGSKPATTWQLEQDPAATLATKSQQERWLSLKVDVQQSPQVAVS